MLRVLRMNQETHLLYKTAQIFTISVNSVENKVVTIAKKYSKEWG